MQLCPKKFILIDVKIRSIGLRYTIIFAKIGANVIIYVYFRKYRNEKPVLSLIPFANLILKLMLNDYQSESLTREYTFTQ